MSFEKLNLNAKTLQAIADVGYVTPTPVQEKAIPLLLAGRDIIALAQTGSGKTASFILPLLDILSQGRTKSRMPRSLVVEPTRELAHQVAEDFALYGKYHAFTTALLIGGESLEAQEKKLLKTVDVIIATPGRLLDLYDRGRILLNDIKMFIIDEADRMLDMGFIPDIERIASLLPPQHQTAFFSATMPPLIQALTHKFLKHPESFSVSLPTDAAISIKQYILHIGERHKKEALKALLKEQKLKQVIVFCNRKREVDAVYTFMRRCGFKVGALHGDLTQRARNETLKSFKEGTLDLLIASDIAARGLDIEDLAAVINLHVPTNPEDYIHRIGRTGRAGKEGKSFTFVSPSEEKHLALILKTLNKKIDVYTLTLDLKQGTEKLSSPPSVPPSPALPPSPPLQKPSPQPPSLPQKKIGFGEDIPAFMQIGNKKT